MQDRLTPLKCITQCSWRRPNGAASSYAWRGLHAAAPARQFQRNYQIPELKKSLGHDQGDFVMTKKVGRCGLMQDRQLPVACATQRLELYQDNFSVPPNVAYTMRCPAQQQPLSAIVFSCPSCPCRFLVVTVHKTVVL